jgi:hypothetical protein
MIETKLMEYGILGLIVLALSLYILKREKETRQFMDDINTSHRTERKEWRDEITKQSTKSMETIDRYVDVMSGLKNTMETIGNLAIERRYADRENK